jgi:hypothetical protein
LTLPGLSLSLRHAVAFYFFAYALVVLGGAGLRRILDSPFGAVLQAIRENSDRAVPVAMTSNDQASVVRLLRPVRGPRRIARRAPAHGRAR